MFCLSKSRRARSNVEDDEIDEPLCSTCSALSISAPSSTMAFPGNIPSPSVIPQTSSINATNVDCYHSQRVGQHLDVGPLKRWIRICRNKHREKCEEEYWRGAGEVLPPIVRVVDVARMAIVPAPPTCRYVTLSYVWGGPGDLGRVRDARHNFRYYSTHPSAQ